MNIVKNFPIKSKHQKFIVMDMYYRKTNRPKPLVIFCHGYKGYKDWGVFDTMSTHFVTQGLALLKFNFSHNGGTLEQPVDFPDLEAFGNNNYIKELDDLKTVIDWISDNEDHKEEIDTNNIILIGHSRGGGIAILHTAEDPRIKKLVTWAAVSTLNRSMFREGNELEQWKKEGVLYVVNGRTKQQMPHYIQFYENYMENKTRLNIENACKNIAVPHLIIHGEGDDAVPFLHAENLHSWNPKSKLYRIPNANHVFGAKQPWTKPNIPTDFKLVLDTTFKFLQ